MKSRYGNHMATGEGFGQETVTGEMLAELVLDFGAYVERFGALPTLGHSLQKLIAMALMCRFNREYGPTPTRHSDELLIGLTELSAEMAGQALGEMNGRLHTFFDPVKGDCFVEAVKAKGRLLAKSGAKPTKFITDLPPLQPKASLRKVAKRREFFNPETEI